MRSASQTDFPESKVHELFEKAADHFRCAYGERTGFDLRNDLFWPKDGHKQRQLNFNAGPLAGLEVHYIRKADTASGTLTVRARGALEYRVLAGTGILGVLVAACTFIFLFIDGFSGSTFITGSRANATPHFHFGAVVLYAFVPAILLGILAWAAVWPLSRLVRPLCWIANWKAGIESPQALLAILGKGS